MNTLKPHILVVDDNTTNRDILVKMLQGKYDLGTAANGKTALEYLENKHPDLVLLDIMMPDIIGLDVCKIIKKNDETKDIPVIFITGLKEKEDIEKGIKAGASGYITKPFRYDNIIETIEKNLNEKNN